LEQSHLGCFAPTDVPRSTPSPATRAISDGASVIAKSAASLLLASSAGIVTSWTRASRKSR
jgi:hypothetical protein